MSTKGPLIFLGLMSLCLCVPLLVAVFANIQEYGREQSRDRREYIAVKGFALTMPVAASIVAVIYIGYSLIDQF